MPSRPIFSLVLPQGLLPKLLQAGYSTVEDLQRTSVELLAKELGITIKDAATILSCSTGPSNQYFALPLTQSAASMASNNLLFSTRSPAVDHLLSGGLPRGHMLEVSGPPGTPKESIAINTVVSFVEAGHEAIFVDCQNMTSPSTLFDAFKTLPDVVLDYPQMIYHVNIQALHDLMVFIHNIPIMLNSHPKVALLVLNSVSFPFQGAHDLTMSAKTALLERIRKTFIRASSGHNLTIVTTSQLSTKILNADGTPGTFDTGAKGIMVPQLGPGYISSGKTHRISFAATGQNSGLIRLLSSPKDYSAKNSPPSVPYEITKDGRII